MDWEKARFNMVEQQIRTWEVFDGRVLETLRRVRREVFVPEKQRLLAFADVEVLLPGGERMLRPVVEAKTLQALMVQPTDRVLEIGTGSGFFAACLAQLAQEVVTVERNGQLAEYASERLRREGVGNVRIEVGNGFEQNGPWWQAGPFDAIVLSGAVRALPRWLTDHLTAGGRLFAFVGQPPVMEAVRVVCAAPGAYRDEAIFETLVPYLVAPGTPAQQAA